MIFNVLSSYKFVWILFITFITFKINLKNYKFYNYYVTVYIQPQNTPYGSYVVEDISQHSNKVSNPSY